MSGWLSFISLENSLIVAMVTSIVLGMLLLFINVLDTEYSKRLIRTKKTIAYCFLISVPLYYVALTDPLKDQEGFASMVMLVLTALASTVLSYSLINLIKVTKSDSEKFFLRLIAVVLISVVYLNTNWWDDGWQKLAVGVIYVLLYIIQCVTQIVVFDRTYKNAVKQLELYYDEEEDFKIKWIRFCYIIMMLTQMFVLVYMFFPSYMKIYILLYSFFLIYFTANFISFLGRHKLVFDAFAHTTLSGQELKSFLTDKKKAKNNLSNETIKKAAFVRLEAELERWVKEKKYRRYDVSREEIADELNTTKEVLNLYFSIKKGEDFRTWRTKLRLEDAKGMLLKEPNLSVNLVGELVGFSDRANFHRQFVKYTGCSPKQWRQSGGEV